MADALSRRAFLQAAAVSIAFAGCGGSTARRGATGGLGANATLEDRLVVAAYYDFFATANRKRFVRETDVRFLSETYSSEDELLSKLASGRRLDAVLPTPRGLKIMLGRGQAMRLDPEHLPNLANVSAFARRAPDRELAYSVPKDVGFQTFAWRPDVVDGPRSIREGFELLARLPKGTRVAVPDSPSEVIGLALIALGHSANSEDRAELREAQSLLLEFRPRVTLITSAPADFERAKRGEFDIAIAPSGDAINTRRTLERRGEAFEVLIPEDRTLSFLDLWVIPANAPHPVAAHRWLNLLLEPASAVAEMRQNPYRVPVDGALERLPAALRKDPVLNAPDALYERSEQLRPVSVQATRERSKVWTAFKQG